jgi:Siphovirus Gp157
MLPAETPAPPPALSLFALEESLQCLLDSAELVEPEQQAAFHADLEATLANTVAKRDRVNHLMAHCESQSALAALEIKRLQARKAFFESVLERVEASVVRTIYNLGVDAKRRYKKLEGDTVTFSVRRCPATVAITDEAAVPAPYKSVSITLPAITWEALLDSLDIEARTKLLNEVRRPDSSVSKTLLKAAIEAGAPDWKERLKGEGALPVSVEGVPGASIVPGGLSLVRK